jgi:hypothetical protein
VALLGFGTGAIHRSCLTLREGRTAPSFSRAATNRQFVVNRTGRGAFAIDTPLYGLGDSERCVEIPWVLSRFHHESRVLAEPRYSQGRNSLGITSLVGLDLAAISQPGILV